MKLTLIFTVLLAGCSYTTGPITKSKLYGFKIRYSTAEVVYAGDTIRVWGVVLALEHF